MELKQTFLILLPIFIILLVVTFRTINNSLKFDTLQSLVMSVAISLLAIIGVKDHIRELSPLYAAFAISILFAPLLAFLFKQRKSQKTNSPKYPKRIQITTSTRKENMKTTE
ncbi:MAG: hypothetical protein ABFD79_10925 [Phycisphaerales bacterium]